MLDDLTTAMTLLFAGFGSGLSVGMGSGTAGPIIIPCLTLLAGVSIHQAIGTSLLVDCVIGGVAGFLFFLNGHVNLRTAALLVIPGVTGGLLGSHFTAAASESGLNAFLGLLLLMLGVNFIINGIQKNLDFVQNRVRFKWFKKHKILFFIVFGFLLGALSGFLGIGVGAIIALTLIFVVQYDIHTAIGTSLVIMTFIAGSGALGHLFNGEITFGVAWTALISAGLGAASGSFFANKINADFLGRCIGAVILIFGIIILVRTFL